MQQDTCHHMSTTLSEHEGGAVIHHITEYSCCTWLLKK